MNRTGRSAAGRGAVAQAAVVAACGMLLAGCSTVGQGSPSASAETLSPSSAKPSGPAMPAAAKATTNAGAEAFVRHWFATYNHALSNLNADELAPISDQTCVFCNRAKQTIEDLAAKSRTVSGGGTTISNVKLIRGGAGGMRLDCAYDQSASSILDGTGATITSSPAKKSGKMLLAIKWTGSQWTMLDVAVLS
jgi:hypothetical protein